MSNVGIHRQIEKFEGLHNDELLETLYGDSDTLSDWDQLGPGHSDT